MCVMFQFDPKRRCRSSNEVLVLYQRTAVPDCPNDMRSLILSPAVGRQTWPPVPGSYAPDMDPFCLIGIHQGKFYLRIVADAYYAGLGSPLDEADNPFVQVVATLIPVAWRLLGFPFRVSAALEFGASRLSRMGRFFAEPVTKILRGAGRRRHRILFRPG